MTSGYPTNDNEAGTFHPVQSSEDDDAKPGRSLSGLEIAIIVSTVASFFLVLFFVFYCRRAEQKRRTGTGTVRGTPCNEDDHTAMDKIPREGSSVGEMAPAHPREG